MTAINLVGRADTGWGSEVREHRHLLRGSTLVMAGFVAQAVTGIVFWLVAVRRFASADVGRAAAAFASMQFVNYVTALGLQEMLARFHRQGRSDDGLLAWGVVATVLSSAVGTVVYLALVVSVRDTLESAGALLGMTLFFVMAAGAAVALLADVRFMGERRWTFVFWRLLLVGAARIPALWLPAPGSDALWLFAVMATPIALSGFVSLGVLRAGGTRLPLRPVPAETRTALRYAGVNYVAQLAISGPQFALPVVVLVNVSASANANFFLAWAMAAVVMILPVTIGRVLVVEGSRPGADLEGQTRRAALLAAGVTAAAAGIAWLAHPVVVAVFGSAYRGAARILPALVAAGIPWSVTSVALAHSRVRHDPLGTVAMSLVLASGILGLAVAWVPEGGIDGAARAWLVGNLIASVVALGLWRRARDLPVAVVGRLRLRASVRGPAEADTRNAG